jgi:hypothetical protein
MLGISNRLPNLVYVFMDSVNLGRSIDIKYGVFDGVGGSTQQARAIFFGLVHIKKKT